MDGHLKQKSPPVDGRAVDDLCWSISRAIAPQLCSRATTSGERFQQMRRRSGWSSSPAYGRWSHPVNALHSFKVSSRIKAVGGRFPSFRREVAQLVRKLPHGFTRGEDAEAFRRGFIGSRTAGRKAKRNLPSYAPLRWGKAGPDLPYWHQFPQVPRGANNTLAHKCCAVIR